jgi:hypothetical protein
MKILLLILLFAFSLTIFGQHKIPATFGKPTLQELNMDSYPEDPDAAGVVLFDQGVYKVEEIDRQMTLVKEVHSKIKVIDAKNFEHGEIEIIYYKGDSDTEKITEIKAITHQGGLNKYLNQSQIFTTDLSPRWKSKKFTFPDIEDGSVLEFSYRIESPYFFNLGGWNFQGELPTLYSEFYTEIPGNFKYNKAAFGTHRLSVNEAKLKHNCFSLSYANQSADCETSLYIMENIPAFKEEEYMLSKKNYIARISYELKEYANLVGETTRFSKSWQDVDKELRYDKDLGRQLKSKSFFEKNIPTSILAMPLNKDKAMAIYYYIKNHFVWNNEFGIFSEVEVKDAFKERVGSGTEINLALINALNAGGFEAHMVLGSTRQNGLPTPFYPVISDFNYVFAALVLDAEITLLDATRKNAPFGLIPFELLNKQGRLMDFKNNSRWIPITPFDLNLHSVRSQLVVNEDGQFIGKARENYTGYLAYSQRSLIDNNTEKSYVKNKATTDVNTELSALSMSNVEDPSKNFEMIYDLSISPEMVGTKYIINPFFFKMSFEKNPFTLKERSYPVDFGCPFKTAYSTTFDLAEQYTVVSLPKDVSIGLPDNKGSIVLKTVQIGNVIQMRYALSLTETKFTPSDYNALKQFFETVIKTQTQSALILEKRI